MLSYLYLDLCIRVLFVLHQEVAQTHEKHSKRVFLDDHLFGSLFQLQREVHVVESRHLSQAIVEHFLDFLQGRDLLLYDSILLQGQHHYVQRLHVDFIKKLFDVVEFIVDPNTVDLDVVLD